MGIGGFFKSVGNAVWKGIQSDVAEIVVTLIIPAQFRGLLELARMTVAKLDGSSMDNEQRKQEFIRIIAKAAKEAQITFKGSDYDTLLAVVLKELKGEAMFANEMGKPN